MKKYVATLTFSLIIAWNGFGQEVVRKNIPAFAYGQKVENPYTGGMKAPQFSMIDLDNNGVKDLFVFDRNGGVVTTYLNKGGPGEIYYIHAPEYEAIFPPSETFALLHDFNGDGIEDLFKDPSIGGIGGIEVWRGRRDANGLYFEVIQHKNPYAEDILYFTSGGDSINVYNSVIDIPAFCDVDNDGDTDVLSFEVDGTYLNYYRNYGVELGLGLDTFIMKLESLCFGGFAESMFSSEVVLNPEQTGCADGFGGHSSGGPRHAGSTVLAFDGDCDGDKEVVLGDFLTGNLVYLVNGGSPINAWITDQDTRFPVYDEPADMEVFLSSFYLDINNDGRRDLIVTPNQEDVSKNQNHVWLYLNEGEDCSPVFRLHQKNFLLDKTYHFSRQSHPQFVDFNGDGLLDVLVGTGGELVNGNTLKKDFYLLQNVGTLTEPAYNLVASDYLELSKVPDEISRIAPDLADVDGDGDDDLFLGSTNGEIFYYENTAGPDMPYAFKSPVSGYFDIFIGGNSSPDFYDINGDGLLDILIGESNNQLNYYENQGTPGNPFFDPNVQNLPNSIQIGNLYYLPNPPDPIKNSSPALFFTGMETNLMMGTATAGFNLYNNITSSVNDTFRLLRKNYGNFKVGDRLTCDLADIDGDLRYEMVIGNDRGGIHFYDTDLKVDFRLSSEPVFEDEIAFSFYPNPVRNQLRIQWQIEATGMLSLYNGAGIPAMAIGLNNSRLVDIDVSHLPPGIYFLEMRTTSGFVRKKVIKL